MRVLLDTHAFLWYVSGDSRLSQNAQDIISDRENERLLSVASLWEIAIKSSKGKLTLVGGFRDFMTQQLRLNRVRLLRITFDHVARVSQLPFHHRDPFDRLLIAQSLHDALPVLGDDGAFDRYNILRIW